MVFNLYVTFIKITTGTTQSKYPMLFLGILLTIVGIQLITTGLLGEMITRFNQKDKSTKDHIDQSLL